MDACDACDACNACDCVIVRCIPPRGLGYNTLRRSRTQAVASNSSFRNALATCPAFARACKAAPTHGGEGLCFCTASPTPERSRAPLTTAPRFGRSICWRLGATDLPWLDLSSNNTLTTSCQSFPTALHVAGVQQVRSLRLRLQTACRFASWLSTWDRTVSPPQILGKSASYASEREGCRECPERQPAVTVPAQHTPPSTRIQAHTQTTKQN